MAKPEGVFVQRDGDGELVPCELIHLGVDEEGIDHWRATGPIFRLGRDRIRVAVFPAKTKLSWDAKRVEKEPDA